MSASVAVMGFDLEQHIGLDPHVEIGREELELGLPPSIVFDDLSKVQDTGYTISTSTVIGQGNLKLLRAGPNGSIRASYASATDLQQAELVPAAYSPGSHPDMISWPQLSMCEASMKGTSGEEDLVTTFSLNLRSDQVEYGGTSISRQPPNAVVASHSILPVERLTEYTQEAPEESSPKITCHGNDAPICKELEDAKYQGDVEAPAAELVNCSKGCAETEYPGPTEAAQQEAPKESSPKITCHGNDAPVCKELEDAKYQGDVEVPATETVNCSKDCAETEDPGPTEAAQRLQSEKENPDFESGVMPTSFSDLFQSILASENPPLQLVETAIQPNGLTAALTTVPLVNNPAVKDIANTTTRLMLASLNQPPLRPEPPSSLQIQNALVPRNKMKPNTPVAALEARPASLPIRSASRSSYREGRVASAATKVSEAASAAKSALQAAEASIEALANLGINNGSLYQERNSFINPQPLQVACDSGPAAAGVKRTFQGNGPPIVEQNGGMSTTGTLDLIKIGSTVEVMPEEDGLQGGWFVAKVISMTSKEALVVYDDLMADDGSSHLEESFPLHCSREEDSFGTTVLAAQGWIRPVHPFSSSQKRGHFATVYENLVVGDRVDAFVEDGWWEAIIEELNEADETKITVFFPGDGSTTVVKAWTVRPSLVWKKGEWKPSGGDSVEQTYPPSKRQKTGSIRGSAEREHTKTKVAAAGNLVLTHKKTSEPIETSQTRRSRASKNNDNSIVIYSKKRDTGVTPTRDLRSASRSNAKVAQTKVPVTSSVTPASKTRVANARASLNSSSTHTKSQQIEVAVIPELTWDVRRQSTRLQQKEVSPVPQNLGRGKTPSSRFLKKDVLKSPQATPRRKTPSRRSQHKEVMETPTGKELALIPMPETRLRTRSQMLAATKR